MKRYRCGRCGHRWTGRIKTKPKSCPACKQYSAIKESK